MFRFFKKKKNTSTKKTDVYNEEKIFQEVTNEIREIFSTGNKDAILKSIQTTYNDFKDNEDISGWIAGFVGEQGILPLFEILPDFIERFPTSLYSARAIYADYLASKSKFDGAAENARIYLRVVIESGKFSQLEHLHMIKDGVSRSFTILAGAYDSFGAKSYAIRVLNYAKMLPLEESWLQEYSAQIENINKNLANPDNSYLDGLWEEFFQNGNNVSYLHDMCIKNGNVKMASRIDLIEGKFRFIKDFNVDKKEIFLIERKVKKKDGVVSRLLG